MKKVIIAILFMPTLLLAHPVIYKDGWVYWGSFGPDMNTQRVSYTLHPKFSLEANTSWYQNNDEYRDYMLGANYLVKRWLNGDSQGNIYASYHAGYFKDLDTDGFAQHLMLMGDWESRSLYTAGSVMSFLYNDKEEFKYSYRFGFAPFVAGMNTIQNWLILKLDYFEAQNKKILVTPMMRFFYKNVLWEMGANTQGDYFLTLMIHY